MRVARIMNIGPSCKACGRLYRVVELSGSTYALVIGDVPMVRLGILPIDPGNNGTIDYYDDLSKVQRAWEDCEDAFAASGDQDSADNIGEASSVWDFADGYQLGNALGCLHTSGQR
jgi:hypothetical protein